MLPGMGAVTAGLAAALNATDIVVTVATWTDSDSISPDGGFCISTAQHSDGSGHGSRSPTSYNGFTVDCAADRNAAGVQHTFVFEIHGNNTGAKFDHILLVEDGITLNRSSATTPSGTFSGSSTEWDWSPVSIAWSTGTKTVRVFY